MGGLAAEGDRPLVSIVLPTYNRADTLERAVRSVLAQSYDHLELIVVDDASTDATATVIRRVEDRRVRYLRLAVNRGAAAARNTGVRAARGSLIAFQDSDDEWLPGKLATQVPALLASPPCVAMVYSPMVRVGEDGKEWVLDTPVFTPNDEGSFDRALALGVHGIGIQSCLIRKEALLNVGAFDEQMPRWIDLELFIRLARQYRFQYLDAPLVRYHASPDGITSDQRALVCAQQRLMEKYREELEARPAVLAIYHRLLMTGYFQLGEPARARAQFRALRRLARPSRAEIVRVGTSYLGPRVGPVVWKMTSRILGGLRRLRARVRSAPP